MDGQGLGKGLELIGVDLLCFICTKRSLIARAICTTMRVSISITRCREDPSLGADREAEPSGF